MNRKGLASALAVLFVTVIIAVNAITLTLTARNEQAIQTLLLNGKTASAISAKKTASIAQEIENLVVAYHAQAEMAVKQQERGTKELPKLLSQIESAIASKDGTEIDRAAQNVELFFETHPVPTRG